MTPNLASYSTVNCCYVLRRAVSVQARALALRCDIQVQYAVLRCSTFAGPRCSALNGGLTIGTLCSGTECPAAVSKHLSELLSELCQREVHLRVAFACERDAKKQNWIRTCFPDLPLLFADVQEMGRECAFDVLSRTQALQYSTEKGSHSRCCTVGLSQA